MNKKRLYIEQTFYFLLPLVLFALDILEIFERNYNIDLLGHISCSVIPFAKMAIPFVPYQLVGYAVSQCKAPPADEPAISIIFFMAKISITVGSGSV